MWIGSKSESNKQPFNYIRDKNTRQGIRGIFCQNKRTAEEENFKEKLDDLKRKLNLWKLRNLSIYGRILSFKSLGVSKLVYLSLVIHIPEWVIKQAQKIIYDFIWQGKKDKGKRKVLINERSKGGLEMIDIRSMVKAAKAMWVKRYLEDRDSQWKRYFDYSLKNVGGKFLFSCSFDTSHLNTYLEISIEMF